MSRAKVVLGGLALASATAVTAVAARRTGRRHPAVAFYDVALDRSEPVELGAWRGGAPGVFHRSESFQTYHAASLDAVRAALPSDDLHPVRLPSGQAVITIDGLQHHALTAHGVDGLAALPYGEVMVGALVTRRPAPPLVPLVAPTRTGYSAGAFVLQLPVTTRVARDAGRLAFGLPKFVADMEFDDSIEERRVRLAEGGHDILTLRARVSGRPSIARESLVLYSVLAGELIELTLPTYSIRQMRWGRSGGLLELGDHEVADELRGLAITPEPFLSEFGTGDRLAMPLGRPVGAARPYVGFGGADRDLGRYVVRYPNTAPIDCYAPFAPSAGPATVMAAVAPAAELAVIGS